MDVKFHRVLGISENFRLGEIIKRGIEPRFELISVGPVVFGTCSMKVDSVGKHVAVSISPTSRRDTVGKRRLAGYSYRIELQNRVVKGLH